MAIPQSFIQELVARADVVEVVGRHVQLKKGGANFMGLCPFHGEKSPSFSVSPAKQFYHCFGCGKTGNVISFLMEHAGMSFIEAVEDLAQQFGLQVPEDDVSPQDRAKAAQARAQQATLSSVLEKAGAAYIKHLRGSEKAISYFKGRGLSGDIAKTFGLGYAPEGWRALASVFPDYNDPLLVESGLVITGEPGEENAQGEAKRYDRFRDRVMFPIRNVKGECIGFGGRVLGDDKPKYLNSPETPVFSKGRELYGLFEARTALREHGYALVTEGYMDVVALAQLGFANAVATLGTACTAEHVQKLFRFTESVVFSFDGDNAGRRAARKALDAALPFATDVRTVKFLFLPSEHDPDSYIREHGQEGFADCVKKAVPLSRFMIEAAADGCDLDTAEGRAHMASNARPLWNLLPEGALRAQLLAEIADKVMIDGRDLMQLWQPTRASGKSYQKKSNTGNQSNGYRANQSTNSPSASAMPDFPDYPDFSDNPEGSYDPLGMDDSASGGLSMPDYPPPSYDPGGYSASSSSKPAWTPGRGGSKKGPAGIWSTPAPRRVAGRMLPASREDRVLRLLLTQPDSWDRLSAAEHQVLLGLPAPHGPLFAWLVSQIHEHGPQPWAALREGLRGHANERHAVQQISQMMDGVPPDWNEARSILAQLLELQRQAEITALIARADEPEVMQRLRELMAQTPKKLPA
jgi:DNA primase